METSNNSGASLTLIQIILEILIVIFCITLLLLLINSIKEIKSTQEIATSMINVADRYFTYDHGLL